MQCSCHISHTFVPRTRPVAASSLQLTSSFHGSQVGHARFVGSPLQCKPIRFSGTQHRCVTSMASKGQHRTGQLQPLYVSKSVMLGLHMDHQLFCCSDWPDQASTSSRQSQSCASCWSCPWCQGAEVCCVLQAILIYCTACSQAVLSAGCQHHGIL